MFHRLALQASALLVPTSAAFAQEYRGQLWRSDDHIVEVYNTAAGAQSYNVICGID